MPHLIIGFCIAVNSSVAELERKMQGSSAEQDVFGENSCHSARTFESYRTQSRNTGQGSSNDRTKMPVFDPRNGFLCQSINYVGLCTSK